MSMVYICRSDILLKLISHQIRQNPPPNSLSGTDTCDPEEEDLNTLQSMKMDLMPGYLAPFQSESRSPPKSPQTDTLSLLSGGGDGETISETTTTTATATSMEVSTKEKGGHPATEEEGQVCQNVNTDEGKFLFLKTCVDDYHSRSSNYNNSNCGNWYSHLFGVPHSEWISCFSTGVKIKASIGRGLVHAIL